MNLERGPWRTLFLIVCVVLPLVIVGIGCEAFRRPPPTPEPVEVLGVQKFYRNVYFKGDVETAGDLKVGGAITTTGPLLDLGNAITDNIRVWGQMRTWDGTDNWADVPTVSDLDQTNGWMTAYHVTGWGTGSTFQSLFANTRITAAMLTTQSVTGAVGKATVTGVHGTGNATATGLIGQVTAETTATIPIAYGVQSLVEAAAAGDTITSSVNFYADLDNTGTITTSRILYTDAVTWTNGLDLSNATFTTADIVLSNGETITNTTDGTIRLSGNTQISGTLELEDVVFSGPIRFGSDTTTADGERIAHGLGTTPTAVVLTVITDTFSPQANYSVAISATNATSFTVAITPVAASGNLGVYWMAGK